MRRYTFILLLFLGSLATAHPKGQFEVRPDPPNLVLAVRPSEGEPWTRKLHAVFSPTVGATNEYIAVASGLYGLVHRFDWHGEPLDSVHVSPLRFSVLWGKGSVLYGLEVQDQSSMEALIPSAGSGLWVLQPNSTTFRSVPFSDARDVLTDAPPKAALSWYAAHALTPPPEFQPGGIGETWELGLRACRGDSEARERLEFEILREDNVDFLAQSKALALCGSDVLEPVLIQKANTLFQQQSRSARFYDWTWAVHSLRAEFRSLALEDLPPQAIDWLPARAALENERELIELACAGQDEAASVLSRSMGEWTPDLPARLLNTEDFPQAPVLAALWAQPGIFPDTVPILLERLDLGEAVYSALRSQAGIFLPADEQLWRSWWDAQNGRPPSTEVQPYTWLMHSLAEQGRLTPEILSRHPRLLARLSLPVPYGLSADGESLSPIAAIRGAIDLPSYTLAGIPLESPRATPPSDQWGVVRQKDILLGDCYEFRTATVSVKVSREAVDGAEAYQSDSFREWTRQADSSVFFSDGGAAPTETASDIDPVRKQTLWTGAEGVVVTNQDGDSHTIRADGWGSFLPDGRVLITLPFGGYSIWDGKELRQSTLEEDQRLTDHAAGRFLLVGRDALHVLGSDGELKPQSFPTDSTNNYFLSLDGNVVYSPGTYEIVYDVHSQERSILPSLTEGYPCAVTTDASRQRLAIADGHGNVTVWELSPEPVTWQDSAAKAVERWTGTRWVDRKVEPVETS